MNSEKRGGYISGAPSRWELEKGERFVSAREGAKRFNALIAHAAMAVHKQDLVKAMAVGISKSAATKRPITGVNQEGEAFIDLPQLADIILAHAKEEG